MRFGYDSYVDNIVGYLITIYDTWYQHLSDEDLPSYLAIVQTLKIYAKQFADSNLTDFANILYNVPMNRKPVDYIKQQYKIYLQHRM